MISETSGSFLIFPVQVAYKLKFILEWLNICYNFRVSVINTKIFITVILQYKVI